MNRYLLVLLIFLFNLGSSKVLAQEPPPKSPLLSSSTGITNDVDTAVFIAVEQMPEFPGGISELGKYLAKNIRFPQNCGHLIGKVTLSFVVSKNGRVQDIEVNPGDCQEWKQHIVSLVKAMPDWKPGKQQKKPVNVRYTIPLTICFQTE